MGTGPRADALGDGNEDGTEVELTGKEAKSLEEEGQGEPILREALKGSMQVERGNEEGATEGETKIGEKEIEKLQEKERTVREAVY